MNALQKFGWNYFQSHSTIDSTELPVGRVLSIQGFQYVLISERGELTAELSGKLLYGASNEDLPKVGDWVTYTDYETMGYIIDVLPRINMLSRKNPGEKTERQVLAANVDSALIVQGLDRDFNLMRLERYIVQIISCGIKPVVILNKLDLIDNPAEVLEKVKSLSRDCPVFFCSTITGEGLSELKSTLLTAEQTFILIGSSGAGKSSLLNALSKNSVQEIGAVSDANAKGKHTTTTRDLFLLDTGAMIIDSPGMREFGLTDDEEGAWSIAFPAISNLATGCRFTDCQHLQELGCAVLESLSNGTLDANVYDSYIKLMKERSRFSIRAEDKKRMGKQFGKMTREAQNFRKKYKY